MDAAKEKLPAVKVMVEDVDQEFEEEFEEEIEEEEIEEEEEEEGDGDEEGEQGAGESEHSPVIENVDSAGEDKKKHDSTPSSSGKIFVGGVAWDTTEETFYNYFAKYGEITDSVIMKDKHTQNPRGFGFVTFADSSIIDKVLEDDHSIDGRVVEVKRTVPKGGPKSKKIFVGGIPTSLTEDEFKEHFSSYGVVVDHQIMVDHSTGRSRGFGFITFENEEPVEKIISMGKMHELAGKQVEIKKAEPKKGEVDGRGGGYGGGSYGYGGGHRSMGGYYQGREGGGGGGFYDRGFGYGSGGGGGGFYERGYGYGGPAGYNAGFYPNYTGPMYGSGGGNFYGMVGGYGAAYNGYGGGRGYGNRYHPYGR